MSLPDFAYESWPSGEPYDWSDAVRGERPDDQLDFHLDLGCGKLKKGRIGVDRFPAPGVNVLCDLDALHTFGVPDQAGADAAAPEGYQSRAEVRHLPYLGLPFESSSIESIISHHALEHIGNGFIRLMDECYRVLKPGAPFRIIVPLFPSTAAVEDPDHKRWFMDGTFDAFCGHPDHIWLESFSVPYTEARFELTDRDTTPPTPPPLRWTHQDRREMRVTLRPRK